MFRGIDAGGSAATSPGGVSPREKEGFPGSPQREGCVDGTLLGGLRADSQVIAHAECGGEVLSTEAEAIGERWVFEGSVFAGRMRLRLVHRM